MSETIVHVRCGSDILPAIAAAGLPGDRVSWSDPVSEGPVPADLPRESLRTRRSVWLAHRLGRAEAEIAAKMEDQDRDLDQLSTRADDIVLWFEHDLFDQTVLIALLDRLAPRTCAGQRLSLVCIDRHPDVARFTGLGNLEAHHLPALFEARVPVTPTQITLGQRAWAAYRSPTPQALLALLTEDTAALPFLAPALTRHCQQFPWKAEGLSLTQWLALDGLDICANTAAEAFGIVHERETAPWQGDIMFFADLRELAREPHPLIAVAEPGAWGWETPIQVTRRGRDVLLGKYDALDGRPMDTWRGGVHLIGERPSWRWDSLEETLIEAPE